MAANLVLNLQAKPATKEGSDRSSLYQSPRHPKNAGAEESRHGRGTGSLTRRGEAGSGKGMSRRRMAGEKESKAKTNPKEALIQDIDPSR